MDKKQSLLIFYNSFIVLKLFIGIIVYISLVGNECGMHTVQLLLVYFVQRKRANGCGRGREVVLF